MNRKLLTGLIALMLFAVFGAAFVTATGLTEYPLQDDDATPEVQETEEADGDMGNDDMDMDDEDADGDMDNDDMDMDNDDMADMDNDDMSDMDDEDADGDMDNDDMDMDDEEMDEEEETPEPSPTLVPSPTLAPEPTAAPTEEGVLSEAVPVFADEDSNVILYRDRVEMNGGVIFTYEGVEGEVLSITISADAPGNRTSTQERQAQGLLDAYLVVRDPNGEILIEADDILDGIITDSLVPALILPESGEYEIEVRSWSGNTEGEFTLVIISRDIVELFELTPQPGFDQRTGF